MNEKTRSALLINVGGTAEPIAYSIDLHRPEKVIFFTSKDSRKEIESRIRGLVAHRWQDQDIVTTSDPQDLTECIRVLSAELPRSLALLGIDWGDLVVDYTGGTKTMSAAVVLGTINEAVQYSYIGGRVRTKEGLGTVLDGSEAVVLSPNPWDVLALELTRRMARQFDRGHFEEARETAAEAKERVSPDKRPFFEDLHNLFDAYSRWSLFDYARVKGLLHKALGGLQRANDPALADFLRAVKADAERLARIEPVFQALQRNGPTEGEGFRELLVDLVANAVRLVRLAGRPDDGVARLYSAIEKLAKAALKERGIDNGNADPKVIPESLRESFVQRFLDPKTHTLRFGLDASYRLLAELGDPIGQKYLDSEQELSQILNARNGSLLVHGWSPVKTDLFDRMLAIALDFLGLREEELPALPPFPRGVVRALSE